MFCLNTLVIALFTIFFIPVFAVAQEAGVDLNLLADQIAKNLSENKMVAFAAGLILLMVFLFRKYIMPTTNLASGSLPWISLLLGFLVGFLGLVSGGVSLAESVNIMLVSGPGASALWAGIFKLMANK